MVTVEAVCHRSVGGKSTRKLGARVLQCPPIGKNTNTANPSPPTRKPTPALRLQAHVGQQREPVVCAGGLLLLQPRHREGEAWGAAGCLEVRGVAGGRNGERLHAALGGDGGEGYPGTPHALEHVDLGIDVLVGKDNGWEWGVPGYHDDDDT